MPRCIAYLIWAKTGVYPEDRHEWIAAVYSNKPEAKKHATAAQEKVGEIITKIAAANPEEPRDVFRKILKRMTYDELAYIYADYPHPITYTVTEFAVPVLEKFKPQPSLKRGKRNADVNR